jgi:hypothetical protein
MTMNSIRNGIGRAFSLAALALITAPAAVSAQEGPTCSDILE